MKINELKPNTAFDELTVEVTEKGEVREFSKFGKTGRVCSCTIKDDSGEAKLSLWNEQVDLVNQGDKLSLKNGWVKEFRNELQISTGRNGTMDKL